MTQKIGILGGTFDPVHTGHLALAEAAGKVCSLDEIILVPAAVPPHKQDRTITDFSHRVAMLEIAVHNRPSLHVSTIEQLLPYPSFTIDTLNYLRLHSVSPVEFFFISGADTFLDILSWKEYQKVLQMSNFIVFLRSGSNEKELQTFLKRLHFTKKTATCWYSETFKTTLYSSTLSLPTVSSSEIRNRASRGQSTRHLTPEGVTEYIAENRLYTI
ncbi:MAG: nicotinate-nucleotide adenylyltransferase [Desulfocapsa sp.]|nr:nicotinate-nucleotide adenylyltransferase [Desulfocapsa sp.]